MGVRVRPKARESAANKAPEPRGLWRWLKEKDNRTVLQFVGAGIVALIGVLTTMGILHQPASPETHPVQAATAPSAPPPPQPVNQSATANGDAATNVSGSSNVVVIRK
ncbi:hypothetical protein [Paraburkholderia sediminicola]|uniref:hypothetical protein n=1 Tax=Paraburkholderia sediminicola TaxID=458836 RepID=UPI0038B9E3FB